MSTDHDIKVMNSLIGTVIDNADGYTEAARAAGGSRYSEIFQRRGAERQELAVRLQGKVRSLGGTPEDDGTMLARAHRMFLSLCNSLSSDETAIVDQAEAGEDHIKHKFAEAQSDREVSPGTMADIHDAYSIIKAGHDEIRDLGRSLHAGI